MNREGAKNAKSDQEEDLVLTSRLWQIRGLIIRHLPKRNSLPIALKL
jgi:hypothetical protein